MIAKWNKEKWSELHWNEEESDEEDRGEWHKTTMWQHKPRTTDYIPKSATVSNSLQTSDWTSISRSGYSSWRECSELISQWSEHTSKKHIYAVYVSRKPADKAGWGHFRQLRPTTFELMFAIATKGRKRDTTKRTTTFKPLTSANVTMISSFSPS